jgi:oxygen-independent coproporphyrinogen-3 oxidase
MACGAHGVDLYQLIGLGGTRIDKASEKGKVLGTQASEFQADSQTRANMYAFGANRLESKDWQRLSSCHWRRDVRERSIYNSLAKSGIEILPFGAGAGGSIHGHGMMNARDLSEWHQAQAPSKEAEVNSQLASQCLPAKVPGMTLSPNPSAAFDAIFKRGLDSGILNFTALEADVVTHLHPLFEAWQQHGLATLDNHCLSLTLAGRFWNVNMQTGLFEFLATNPIAEAKIAS